MSSHLGTDAPGREKRPRRGSTVVEAVTLLLLVGIITRVAIPPMGYVLTRARATEARATFSAVEGAANRLALENLPWPPDAAAGVVPVALRQRLPPGFSFDHDNYQLDWQNWTLPDGLPGNPSVYEEQAGISAAWAQQRAMQEIIRSYDLSDEVIAKLTDEIMFVVPQLVEPPEASEPEEPGD